LFCGNAGTLLRLVTAALATRPGRWHIDGSERMRQRPIAPLLDALRQLGVEAHATGVAGHPPVLVRGGVLAGGRVKVDAGQSSQYLSALLLAALAAQSETLIEVQALTSTPYIELTLSAAQEFGGRIEREPAGEGTRFRVSPGIQPPDRVSVEGDWSAACYPAAAAALTGGRVLLRGLRATSVQGDRSFLALLEQMGASVETRADGIVVTGGAALEAVEADLSTMPDQVPTLAALAPFAKGTTRIRGVPHLRIKESDRLRAMATELTRVGAHAEERPDGLVIDGVWADSPAPDFAVEAQSWNDHRIAMSMALVGLRRPGIQIARPEVVQKSYPTFWEDFDSMQAAE
jgi:3-phosphoshikimate 1-carboxyvinyltransferase